MTHELQQWKRKAKAVSYQGEVLKLFIPRYLAHMAPTPGQPLLKHNSSTARKGGAFLL